MGLFLALIALTLVVGVVDWWAASTDRTAVEYVFKPATMVVLFAAAAVLPDPASGTARWCVLLALVWSLVGDVCLMLGERLFLSGLVAFLLAHVAYTAAMIALGTGGPLVMVGTAVVLVAAAVIGSKVTRGAREVDERMVAPIVAYLVVISFMVVVAIGTGNPWAIVGALLFYVSDGLIGWSRFVRPVPHRDLLVMSTYHLGQIGLVLSLTL
ncbi:MAG: lysoplasmalogenase [Microthrixaceae bacterium]